MCGGRAYADAERMRQVLDEIHEATPISQIIHGAARGADTIAHRWAQQQPRVAVWPFPADWAANGKAAGPMRNARMLAEGKPELVLAFPGGKGTEDMVARARGAGIEVREVAS